MTVNIWRRDSAVKSISFKSSIIRSVEVLYIIQVRRVIGEAVSVALVLMRLVIRVDEFEERVRTSLVITRTIAPNPTALLSLDVVVVLLDDLVEDVARCQKHIHDIAEKSVFVSRGQRQLAQGPQHAGSASVGAAQIFAHVRFELLKELMTVSFLGAKP